MMKSIYLYIATVVLLSLNACKKEYPALPYTNILSFSVTDANGESLKAVIENNEIMLYWPVGQVAPQDVTPSIKIADKASIFPATGTKVAFNESVTYKVTAEDGSVATYKLKPVVNSFIPLIKAFHGVQVYNSKAFVPFNGTAQLAGDFFDPAEGKTQVFFISSSGQDVPVKIKSITPIFISLDHNVATGSYEGVKVVAGNKHAVFTQAFDLIPDPKPSMLPTAVPAASTIKRGTPFTLTGGANLNKVNSVELMNLSTRAYTAIILKSTTANSLTLEIPQDFPLGTYVRIRYNFPASDYYAAGNSTLTFTEFPITVNE